MKAYFQNPEALRVSVQAHSAHERRRHCTALTMLQIQANGDVIVCVGLPPVGNITAAPIRQIWERRPHAWERGCCLSWRCPGPDSARRPERAPSCDADVR
jgi:hypothetical protein